MAVTLMNPDGLPTIDAYRQVAVATGSRMVFVAGQVAWDADGVRQAPIDETVTLASTAQLPPSVAGEASEIANQVALVLAVHQMRGDAKVPLADFFDSRLGAVVG